MEALGTGMGQPKEEIFIFGCGIIDPEDKEYEKEHIEHTEKDYKIRMAEKEKEIDEMRKAMDLETRYDKKEEEKKD